MGIGGIDKGMLKSCPKKSGNKTFTENIQFKSFSRNIFILLPKRKLRRHLFVSFHYCFNREINPQSEHDNITSLEPSYNASNGALQCNWLHVCSSWYHKGI